MKRLIGIGFSFVTLMGIGATVHAVSPPPLDRPTPPACCADGICYPRPSTFGWYPVRWRQWPTTTLEPTPDGVTPTPERELDVPSFDLPPAEEEDRRAPPPTMPPGEDEEDAQAVPGAETPQAVPLTPPGGPTRPAPLLPFDEAAPGTEPPTLPFDQPFGEPGTEPAPSLPFDQQPATEPPPGLPFGPTGDLDPPPAPPFASPATSPVAQSMIGTAPAKRAADRAATTGPTAAPAQRAPTNDPPPSWPLSLARAGH